MSLLGPSGLLVGWVLGPAAGLKDLVLLLVVGLLVGPGLWDHTVLMVVLLLLGWV